MKIKWNTLAVTILSMALSSGAFAQDFGNHSGPVAGGNHGSVVNSHSSDGNTSAAAHAGQQVIVRSDDDTRVVSGAAMPAFSDRGPCGGAEGSAQAGGFGGFLGFSWGSSGTFDCELRYNLEVITHAYHSGLLQRSEVEGLYRHAISQMTGFDGMQVEVEQTEHFRIVKYRRID